MFCLRRLLQRNIQLKNDPPIASLTRASQHPLIETGVDIKPFEAIPGPVKLPYFKSSWAFLPFIGRYDNRRLELSHLKLYNDYGKIVRLEYPGGYSYVMLYDHELFQRVSDIEYHKGIGPRRLGFIFHLKSRQTKLEKYPNLGIFNLWGDSWKDLRHATHKPLLRFPSVRQYINPMDEVTKDFVERIRDLRDNNLEIDDFYKELSLYASESLGVFILNKRFGSFENPDNDVMHIHQAAADIFVYMGQLEFDARWESHFAKKSFEKLGKEDDRYTDLVYKVLSEALEERKTAGVYLGPSMLDSFLAEDKMDMDKLKGIMLDLFLAGSTTMASIGTFLLYHLSANKIQQQRLYQEILREFPTKDAPVTPEKLDNMLYLRACVKENLRLHPVVVGTGRIFEYDVSVGGYHMPKGTIICSVTPLTSRMEKYFELPNKFLPERWLYDIPEAEDLRQSVGLKREYVMPAPHAAVPFGHGVRMCDGRRFAEQEFFIMLIRLLQNFQLSYEYQDPLEMLQAFLIMPAQPIRLKFTEREYI